MKYIEHILEKYDAVIAGDTEFANKLSLPSKYCSWREYKKIICKTTFVLTQLQLYGQTTRVYEHPDIGLGLLPSWENNCVFVDYLGLEPATAPRTKTPAKQYRVAYFFYYSAFDVFGLFRDKETQIQIAKQLLGGRLLRESSFPNCLRTGEYVRVLDEKGKPEIREVCIKLFDAKGYTPAGAKGLQGTFDTWGVPFENKKWITYFDITQFDKEYADTKTLVNVVPEDETPLYLSKHQITVNYASGDGLTELFILYENIHNSIQETAKRLKLDDNLIKNFQTIGNAANQIGVGAILKEMGMNTDKLSLYQLAQYLYPSSGYALLDGYHHTVNQLLNIDGGYCKNLKPCQPRILDLVLDMDLQGAYVASMKSLPYPVGIPCVYSFPKDRDYRPNFYKEYSKLIKKDMLYPGAWVARISLTSSLSFKQDLIFSKLFGNTDFEKSLVDDGEGFFVIDDSLIDELNNKKILAEIPDGAFQLLNNDVISGILTHDILQFIQTYWTKSEQKEFFEKVHIVSMIFYNKKFLVDTETFKREFANLNDEIHHSFEDGVSTIKDKRKAVWTIIDTDDSWFGGLQIIRNELKTEAKKAKDNNYLNKFVLLNASQNGTKNINNSSYGVSGSVFYQTEKPMKTIKEDGSESYNASPKMGNVIFAQNTTARVRLAAYCMAKSGNGYPVITDGTPLNINEVWSWDWENQRSKNCFGSDELWKLSRYNRNTQVDPARRFNVQLKPLGSGDKWEVVNLEPDGKWVTITNGDKTIRGGEEKWEELDEMLYRHTKHQFGKLDIFKSDLMKYVSKDLYKGAAFQSQANYFFEMFFEHKGTTTKKKARGYNLGKKAYMLPTLEDEGCKHPYIQMIEDIYERDTANVYIESVFSPELLGVSDFNKSEKITNDYIERGFLPHSPTFRSSKPSPFSLSMFRWNTREQYENWNKKVESWERKTGFAVEILFLSEEMVKNNIPLPYTETVNKIQTLIDNNVDINSLDKKVSDKLKTLIHPQLKREKTFEETNQEPNQ